VAGVAEIDEALRALIEGLIDYAGLFPPAGLEMEPAVRNYLEYIESDERWMLGRFVVPAGRRAELEQALPTPGTPIDLSVLARADLLRDDAAALPASSFEIRLGEELLGGAKASTIASWIDNARAEVREAGRGEASLYLETPLPESMHTVVRGIAAAGSGSVGFKIRTGGLEPEAFPSCEQVARTVIACRDARVAFKATAGLHHPVRHLDERIGAKMHGFLNVFGGATLALEHALDESALVEVLEDEDPASWRFESGELRWRDLSAPATAVRRARRSLATSYGSCSFDEPRDDLRELDLLPAQLSSRPTN